MKLNLDKNERSYMAPIRIETGQYIGERPEARLCRFCSVKKLKTNPIFYWTVHSIVKSEHSFLVIF